MVTKSSDIKYEPNLTRYNNSTVKDIPFNGYLDPYNFIENKRKHYMKNNIFSEIEQIRIKEAQQKINYLKIMTVSESEYEKSIIEARAELERLTENHITEILCIKKLLHIERNILEILNYLIGNQYFHWETFKEKINFYELKFKMEHIDYEKLESGIINKFLSKISSKKEFESDHLKENFSTGLILFNWIKCVLKIYIYRYQNKMLKNNEKSKENKIFPCKDNVNEIKCNTKNLINLTFQNNNDKSDSHIMSSAFKTSQIEMKSNVIRNLKQSEMLLSNKTDLKNKIKSLTHYELHGPSFNMFNKVMDSRTVSIFPKEITKNLRITNSSTHFLANSYPLKNSFLEKEKENFYITNVKQLIKETVKHSNKNIGTDSTVLNQTISNKELKMDYDLFKLNRKKEMDKMHSIPLLYIRTFGQLRKHFKHRKGESQIIKDRHFENIKNISLKESQNNEDLLLRFISKGKLKAVDTDVIENFIEKK